MTRMIEVEIDEVGGIHPLRPGEKLPPGRALLIWPPSEDALGLLLSETSLADWLRQEEDVAWAHLQPNNF